MPISAADFHARNDVVFRAKILTVPHFSSHASLFSRTDGKVDVIDVNGNGRADCTTVYGRTCYEEPAIRAEVDADPKGWPMDPSAARPQSWELRTFDHLAPIAAQKGPGEIITKDDFRVIRYDACQGGRPLDADLGWLAYECASKLKPDEADPTSRGIHSDWAVNLSTREFMVYRPKGAPVVTEAITPPREPID